MSAESIHALSDENPDFQKQIGCINRILHLFERRHFLSGHRQISGQNQRRLTSGQNGSHNPVVEPSTAFHKTTDKNHRKAVKEKKGISTESSTTSFSSTSCSSGLSSLECSNRDSQLELCSSNRTTVAETNGRDSPFTASFRSSRRSPDLRDVVRNSIYRQARSISVKTATKAESGCRILKYVDSPRPVKQPELLNSNVSGPKEWFQVLHKLQEAPWISNERRRTSMASAMQDARRFSCDGRESTDTSKSTVKPKDLPRLSLDSRAGKISCSYTGIRSNYLADLERDANSGSSLNQQESESRTRLSNVVAKLMGLEVLPDSMSINENQIKHIRTCSGVKNHCFHGSPRITAERRQNRTSVSSRNLQKQPISPRLRNADSVEKKPIPNSKFPLEPAPWRHPDGSRSPHRPSLKSRVTHTSESRTNNGSPHNTDLSRWSSSPKSSKSSIVIMKPAKLMQKASNPALESLELSFSVLRGNPIAESAASRKKSIEKQTTEDPTPRINHLRKRDGLPSCPMDQSTAPRSARFLPASKESRSTPGESTSSCKILGTLNLKQPQKKNDWHKQSQPAIPPNSRKTRRYSSRQPTKLNSPRRKLRSRSNFQPSDDELSDADSDVRDMTHHRDAISQQSESIISLASQIEEEVSSINRSYTVTDQKQNKPESRSAKDVLASEPAVISEQPSPVSVLDAAFYGDELPSPLKKKSNAFQEDEDAMNQVDVDHSSSHTEYTCNSAINQKKLDAILLIVQKLAQKLSVDDKFLVSESTNMYNSPNADHQSTLEILLASDLLKNTEYGFKSNLASFLDLKQARESRIFSKDKSSGTKILCSDLQIKLHRKLVSDVVNEILIHEVLLEDYSKHGFLPNILADERPRAWQIWEELRLEVDRLQGNAAKCDFDYEEDNLIRILQANLIHQSEYWTAYNDEIPGLVLDIERLIFKGLISEVITGYY